MTVFQQRKEENQLNIKKQEEKKAKTIEIYLKNTYSPKFNN